MATGKPHNPEDTDGSVNAGHHTLGPRKNQATSGVHRHRKGSMTDGYLSQTLFQGEAPVDLDELVALLEDYGLDGSAFTGGGGGGVTDHGALTGLLDDDHPQYLTQAEADALYGALTTRATKTITSASIASLATDTGNTRFADAFWLMKLTVDRACRIQLYTSSAKRTADASRVIGNDPPLGTDHGVIFDFAANASGSFDLSPQVLGYVPAGADVYWRITNRSGSTSTVQVDLVWLRQE